VVEVTLAIIVLVAPRVVVLLTVVVRVEVVLL
jgi:hypothetical protein